MFEVRAYGKFFHTSLLLPPFIDSIVNVRRPGTEVVMRYLPKAQSLKQSLTLSRNMFDHQLDQFTDNYTGKQNDETKPTLKLNSQEIENKLRFDYNAYFGDWKLSFGAGAQYVIYNNATFARIRQEVRDSAGNVIQPALTWPFRSSQSYFL